MVTVGKMSYGINKREVLILHDEAENIPANSASETVIQLTGGINMEGRGLFLVKWAESDVTAPGSTQGNHLPNYINNINGLFDQCGEIGGIH